MLVKDAREAARLWVAEEASALPAFHGAYLAGSMSAMPDDAELPVASDIDVKVVIDGTDVDADPQKIVFRDAVLDVSYGSCDDVRSPEAVLGSYYTAVHFARQSIISDPTGQLTAIQALVAREYARREWVRKRCEHALATLRESLTLLSPEAPRHDQVLAWLLTIVFTPPMVLVADLRNPTHRRGLANLGEVLARYGHRALHERLLGILRRAAMIRGQVEALLAACAEAFDVAQSVRTTPFWLASNISGFARPIAIGGGQELIADGFHREALA